VQDSFEAAVAVVVGQLSPAQVERGGVGGDLGEVGDEDEPGVGVEVAADQLRQPTANGQTAAGRRD
jgi:hypothetical protein